MNTDTFQSSTLFIALEVKILSPPLNIGFDDDSGNKSRSLFHSFAILLFSDDDDDVVFAKIAVVIPPSHGNIVLLYSVTIYALCDCCFKQDILLLAVKLDL